MRSGTDGPAASPCRELALTQLCRGVTVFYSQKVAAEQPLLAAVQIARQVGDEWTEAYASGHLSLWLTHLGQTSEAAVYAQAAARWAERLRDDLLMGLAGLARGWLDLAQENLEEAVRVLRSVRDLGLESHQHHFIGVYIGLSLFRLDDYCGAAREWHDALRNATSVSNVGGAAGSVAGCAYIAEKLGHAEQACRCLGAAEQIRQRSGSPLFSFWYRHNEAAHESLRSSLGLAVYEAAFHAGVRMHAEDAINEAAEWLQRFGGEAVH